MMEVPGGLLEYKLRNIPSFIVATRILHNIYKGRGETFQETRMAPDRPMVGEIPGTLDGVWAEVALPAEHPRQKTDRPF